MREKLADHIGEYVLCRGWIGGWEDMDNCSTRRLYIKQPTIKRANKDLLYAEQETISTEHHLNLFIKYEDLPDYDTTFELNQPIHFTGEVEEYTRADGTTDFGIYGTKQSTISFKLERIIKSVQDTLDKPVEGIDLTYLKGALSRLDELDKELEECADRLPTFKKTYEEYKTTLGALGWGIPHAIKRTEELIASRQQRRIQRARQNAIEEAKRLRPAPKKRTKKDKEKLIKELGRLGEI